MIDSHCHLHLCKVPIDELIHRAENQGLTHLIQVATDIETGLFGKKIQSHSTSTLNIHSSIGLYPTNAKKEWVSQVALLEQELSSGAFVAVGEMGIDLYHDTSFLQAQCDMLHAQIRLAIEFDLPMIFHIRNSYHEVVEILKAYQGEKKLRGVWHCFEGSLDQALHFIEMGWKISFSGLLTHKKGEPLRDIAKVLPQESLLIETDSPYLSPEPLRRERNEPWKVSYILKMLATLRDADFGELERVLDANTKELFQI